MAALIPEFALIIVVAAVVGGFFLISIYLLAAERYSASRPIIPSVVSTGMLAIVIPTVVMVAVAVFLAAGVHSVMDILESDLELKSWPRTAHQAVYDHITDSDSPIAVSSLPRRAGGFPARCGNRNPGAVIFDGIVQGTNLVLLLDGPTRERSRLAGLRDFEDCH